MINKNLFLLPLLFLSNQIFSQTPSLQWVKTAVGSDTDVSSSVCVDADGNTFVEGYFSSPTLTFGSFTLYNKGMSDIFIVKNNQAGNVLWAKNFGGTDNDDATAMALDKNNNIYLTGYLLKIR